MELQNDVQLPASARTTGKRGSKFIPVGLMDLLAKANVKQGLKLPFLTDGTDKKRQRYATEWQINDTVVKANSALAEADRKKAEELPHFACGIGEDGIIVVRDK